jgi:hydrogenase expression/formation protein HypD
MGCREYEALANDFHVPIVVTGFEPIDILGGILACVRQLEEGRAAVDNQYARTVVHDGNAAAMALVFEVFEVCDKTWRGIGPIPRSGYRLRDAYREHDASHVFAVDRIATRESDVCISGRILRGLAKPCDCPAFGRACTPESPLGATMVSAEGACAAYHQYGRRGTTPATGTAAPDALGTTDLSPGGVPCPRS